MQRLKAFHTVIAAAGALLLAHSASAQQSGDWNPGRVYMTREALQDLVDRFQKSADSPAYSASLRDRTRRQAELIRRRLIEGDFQVGDRIVLEVENQPVLSDTFTVDPGRTLTLPTIGDVPLAGVLRSELKQRVSEYLGTFLRQPIVRASALIRIAVLGGVVQPGFYAVAGDALLTEAVMMAGGPTARANINEIQIERDMNRIWEGRLLQTAITEGRTLDELNLRAGDRVFIPHPGQGFAGGESYLRSLSILIALPLTIVALIRIF